MSKLELDDSNLPGLFQVADRASLDGQRRYLLAARLRLSCVVAAAVFAAFSITVGSGIDVAALCVAFFFFAAVLVELWLLQDKPGEAWYDGRALAESVKTLSWRYAVGGAPFDLDQDSSTTRFARELRALTDEIANVSRDSSDIAPITSRMQTVRESTLSERRSLYIEFRIESQRRWYASKAHYNRSRGTRWRIVLIVAELLGVIAAVLRAFSLITVDLPGVVAACIGAASAWLAIRQHDANANAYSLAAEELALARLDLGDVTEERKWANRVSDAEEAISREHTMWRAARCSPHLVRALTSREKSSALEE